MGNLLIDKDSGFEIETTATRTLPYKNLIWNAITYEMSNTRQEFTRTVYGFLDLLRDLGGLFAAIHPPFTLLVGLFYYRGAFIQLTHNMLPPNFHLNKK